MDIENKTIEELMSLFFEKIEETRTRFNNRDEFLVPYHQCEELIRLIDKKTGQRNLKLKYQLNDAVDNADVEGYENLF